jgi:hypothetical protein
MKPGIHFIFLILLQGFAGTLQAEDPSSKKATSNKPISYAAIDQRAIKAPPSAETSVESLAEYLGKTAKNDREKARAIYRWITEHIAYDVPSFLAKERKDNSPEGVLKSHLCVCEGYAKLFQALCEKAGVEAILVGGRAKATEFLDDPQMTAHAWNAIKLDGEWHLVDATWGAGGIKNKQFVKQFKDYYFLAPPDQFIFTHFPIDSKWQLLPDVRTENEFDAFPPVPQGLFQYGVKSAAILKTIEAKEFRDFVKTYDYPGRPVTIVEAPLDKTLKAGKQYRFRIEAGPFQGFVAENQGRQMLFTPKKGKLHEAMVIAPPGTLKIRGVVSGQPGRYVLWTVLEYTGE